MRLRANRPLVAAAVLWLSACGDSGVAPTATAPISPPPPPPTVTPPVTAEPKACAPYTGPALAGLTHYEGLMHEHSSYSDGDPTKIPADYFQAAVDAGYSFVGSAEHSDTYDSGVYFTLAEGCIESPDGFLSCFANPSVDKLQKWISTAEQARIANSTHMGRFLGIRGFEWTSDIFGHINVYFSQNFSNAKVDGGYATMETFWDWFTRDPNTPGVGGSPTAPVPMGGGSDALAHFNHPGDKCQTENDPTGTTSGFCDWNSYTLVPEAVERMFGMELYNDGNRNDQYHPFYVRALDAGWKLAPIGSEDEHFGEYAVEHRPKTVTVAGALTEDGFREAWLARRVYALSPGIHLRATLLADQDHPMGSTLRCAPESSVPLEVSLKETDGRAFSGEYRLYSNGSAEPIATQSGERARFTLTAPRSGEPARWYYVRVHGGAENQSVAYLAPVWVEAQ